MDKKQFLTEYLNEKERSRLVDVLYDEFAGYCKQNNISEADISNDELLEIVNSLLNDETIEKHE